MNIQSGDVKFNLEGLHIAIKKVAILNKIRYREKSLQNNQNSDTEK